MAGGPCCAARRTCVDGLGEASRRGAAGPGLHAVGRHHAGPGGVRRMVEVRGRDGVSWRHERRGAGHRRCVLGLVRGDVCRTVQPGRVPRRRAVHLRHLPAAPRVRRRAPRQPPRHGARAAVSPPGPHPLRSVAVGGSMAGGPQRRRRGAGARRHVGAAHAAAAAGGPVPGGHRGEVLSGLDIGRPHGADPDDGLYGLRPAVAPGSRRRILAGQHDDPGGSTPRCVSWPWLAHTSTPSGRPGNGSLDC